MRLSAVWVFGLLLMALSPSGSASEPTDAMYAERLLVALSLAPEATEAVAEPVRRARAALDRANQLRSIGDGPRSTLAEAEARAWAELGSEIVKVSRRELEAGQARSKVLNLVDAEQRARADYEMLSRQVSRTRTEVSRVETQPVPPLEERSKRGKTKRGRN